MIFKNKKIIVDSENPYDLDKVDREAHVKNIATLLRNSAEPIVLSVDGAWGSGKTTFLEMLEAELAKDQKTVFFSAWETDFADDPLLVFLAEINSALEKIIGGDLKKHKAMRRIKNIGQKLLIRGVPTVVKLSTAGLLDLSKEIEEGISSFSENISDDLMQSYLQNKSDIAEFKENIAKILKKDNGDSQKIYVFVDELDRCRPTYSIELLERIKHLFDIDGVIFILAMDKVQLSHSIQAIYGKDFDANGYLKRFIDIEYVLPDPNTEKFVDHLYEKFDFNEVFEKRLKYREFIHDSDHLKNTIKVFAKYEKMSLRDIEQFFTKIKLVLLATKDDEFLYPVLLVFFIFLRTYQIDIYQRFKRNQKEPIELINFLHKIAPKSVFYENYMLNLLDGLLLRIAYNEGDKQIDNIIDKHKTNAENEEIELDERRYSGNILSILEDRSFIIRHNSYSFLIEKIEMLNSFNIEN